MANYWINRNGQQEGPYDLQTIINMHLDGNTYAWCSGMENWKKISQISELWQRIQNSGATIMPQQGYQQQGYQQGYHQQGYQQQGYQQGYQQQGYRRKPSMWDYYVKCLKNYATFDGRARRTEYWSFYLFNVLISVGTVLLGVLLGNVAHSEEVILFFSILACIYTLATFIPGLAVLARRLHDTGRAAGWWFISLVPFVGGFILLAWMFGDSEPGENRFGPNPKEQ